MAEWRPKMQGSYCLPALLGGTEDPFFGQPLWLQTRCVGKVLWAYNEGHIEALANYIGATLRERGPHRPIGSMFARMPAWMKKSGNRDKLLKGLNKLRNLAQQSAPGDRSDLAHHHGLNPRTEPRLWY